MNKCTNDVVASKINGDYFLKKRAHKNCEKSNVLVSKVGKVRDLLLEV